MYSLMIALGVSASVLVAWGLRRRNPEGLSVEEEAQLASLRVFALLGAGVGAHLSHFIPTYLGWLHQGPYGAGDLWGRSILGGLLGGWGVLELAKRVLDIRRSTGPSLGAPLALSLAFGRLGCTLAGCCGGSQWQGPWSLEGPDGVSRWPVQPAEFLFHLAAFLVLGRRAFHGRANELDLVAYLALYGMLRFLLEAFRWHPVLCCGLTWYQYLSACLAVTAGALFLLRWARIRKAS